MDAQVDLRHYRSVFISDIHLGTKGCQAEILLDFIRHVDCETLYLVGDIIDGWKLKSGWHWPQSHNDVVQKVLRMARKGVQVIYIPGNHDEAGRHFLGTHFGGVEVMQDAIHETADGRRFLVMHGDEFDGRLYVNDGDWVESCTALVEHANGKLEILEWSKMRSWSVIDRARRADAPEAPLDLGALGLPGAVRPAPRPEPALA